ncbi:hypothetical protein [Burkholderia pseudomallei]|uniref:hypothetical protein n=1 Tax=Burkholderia pseudomallei TaxID=28450 RepID=UPI000F07ACE5|nr:hypothetical protein [Burkholderia pseudomallei]CAJ3069209.1 Uncharacterised protein [Burkholderia pseudomallei]VCK73013.1 Uncharacterised protein [Burkholderia pseudomallei]VCK79879.1 Uncharacterised protein [Burkholderia pseudomallei]VCK80144.1 Uncharacterised protein [Burkholderia pseudomallei]VCK80898.1 Uncharacterised protein [Burkholderia pseudomallei]
MPPRPSPEELAIAEFVQLEPVLAFDATLAVEIPIHPELSRTLSSLSSIVGGVAAAAPAALAHAGGQLYELRFTPEITTRLCEGSLSLQKAIGEGYRSGAVGPNGRYVAQGRLVEAGQASRKLATVAAASFQVISFVVGQEHLSQINAKLMRISEAVDSLRRERQLEREAEIAACLRGLQEDVELLMRGELDEAGQAKVADRLREADALFDRLAHLVDASLNGIAEFLRATSFRKGVLQGLDQTSESLTSKIDEIATWRRLDVFATNLLGYAAQVSLALPLRDPYAPHRMARLQERLNRPDTDFRGLVAMRIEADLKSLFSTSGQRDKRRTHAWIHIREAENQFEVARDRLIERHAEIEDALARKAVQEQEGLRLVVEMGEDGAVRRVYRAEPRPSVLLEPDADSRADTDAPAEPGQAAQGAAGE